jgi:hypothetical protein
MKHLQIIGLLVGLSTILVSPMRSQPNNTTLARNFRPDPITMQSTAGGNVSLGALGGDSKCRGFASAQPNHVIELTSNFPLLDILAYTNNVNTDLTMLVKSSDGMAICADDENQRRNPQLSQRLKKGTYQIWVGYSEQNKSVRYSLSLSESPQK